MFLGTHLSALDRSVISPKTIEAYLATEYRISRPAGFTLLVGQRHTGLRSLLLGQIALGRKVTSSAILTAWNPWSERHSKVENDRAQQDLVTELKRRDLDHIPAYGVDPTGKWPAEESLLVLGINLVTATELGNRFRQNGLVWAVEDALPLLVLLR